MKSSALRSLTVAAPVGAFVFTKAANVKEALV